MEELKKQPVTVFLILINILVFLAVELTGGSEDTMHMLQCGAGYTPAIIQGEYYRIFTSMNKTRRYLWQDTSLYSLFYNCYRHIGIF